MRGSVRPTVALDVSRETEAKLLGYQSLVQKWSPRINLVSSASLQDFRARHILDSAQLIAIPDGPIGHWADLGSGAGLPGIVIAILLEETTPHTKVSLIESDQRKAAFLRQCVRALGLATVIHADRLENVAPLCADVVSARALAPLSRLLPMVRRHMRADGIAILPKGQGAQAEIAKARAHWHFDLSITPSQTQHDSSILRIERIIRA